MNKNENSSAKHSRNDRLKAMAEQDLPSSADNPTTPITDASASDEDGADVKTAALPRTKSAQATATTEATEAIAADAQATTPLSQQTEALPADELDADAATYDKMAGFNIDSAGYPLGGATAENGAYVSAGFEEVPATQKHLGIKVFGITMGVLIAILLIAYAVGAFVFMSRFLPNTTIGEYDISMKTDEEVAAILNDSVDEYQLDVVGNGFSYQATGADVGMTIDSDGIISSMHTDLDPWKWPLLMLESAHDESRFLAIDYDRNATKEDITTKVTKFNKSAKAPVDATIVFNAEEGVFEVKPEEEGTQLAVKAVRKSINEALVNMQPHVTLTDDHLKKPKLYSTDEKLIETAELATGMVSAHVTLSLNGQDVGEVSGEDLANFVTISDDFDVKFDEDAMGEWVNEYTSKFDTIGTERHYTRSDGKEITVRGGVYGWEIDSAATKDAILEAIKDGEETTVDIPCISTADVYNGAGERDWSNRYIDVDISEQHVRFYNNKGNVVWETDCITGTPDGKHDTWEGVWYVNNKESPSTLIGYTDSGKKEYETKVKYWMPFEGNGIGFHDATWQPGFGGDMYASGYGSHGCVNLSYDDAEDLYGMIEIGDIVVVHS